MGKGVGDFWRATVFLVGHVRRSQLRRFVTASYYLSDMRTSATELYRQPAKVFAAADTGEVIIERLGIEYLLIRRRKAGRNLYGALKGSVLKDAGKPAVKWKALR